MGSQCGHRVPLVYGTAQQSDTDAYQECARAQSQNVNRRCPSRLPPLLTPLHEGRHHREDGVMPSRGMVVRQPRC